mmetsp:Transcript_31674/g.57689  ORF Transcript_31674/g.57689 Transcript_31674/m.57689 type:complete len:368 (+) Transcript_31674:155-1258(+)
MDVVLLSLFYMDVAFFSLVVLVVVHLLWLMVRIMRSFWEQHKPAGKTRQKLHAMDVIDKNDQERICGVLAGPSSPEGTTLHNNDEAATSFDCGSAYGSVLLLHKPTGDWSCNESGNYRYGHQHMHGRKRLWEFRWQLKFKTRVQGDVFMGLEQDRYEPVSWAKRCAASSVLAALRGAAGGAMYHSYGDDPNESSYETERPTVVFLLSLIDQLIVTPEGEQPPSLCDSSFPDYGLTKADDRKAFRTALANLELVPGPTYSFAFWSVSQFCDGIRWQAPMRGFMPKVNFQDIGIHPPCFFVMYSLKPQDEDESSDSRHLDSRKSYYVRLAYWSTLVPPDPSRARSLQQDEKIAVVSSKSSPRTSGYWCC